MTSRGIKHLDAASGGHVELDFQVTKVGDLFSLVDRYPALPDETGSHKTAVQSYQGAILHFIMSK